MSDIAAASEGFFRYLVVPPPERAWGLWVTAVGDTMIRAGSPYPPYRHPDDHHFTWSQGRTLNEHQVIYLSRGSGIYEDKRSGERALTAGDCFLLRPGVWHRYRPDPAQGWDEHWFACSGPVAERILDEPFFPLASPVLAHGLDPELVEDFQTMVALTKDLPPGHTSSLTAQAFRIAARLRARLLAPQMANPDEQTLVRQAVCYLHSHLEQPLTMHALARGLGIGYDRLRKAFTIQLGCSPKQYQQKIRLRHAQHLLETTNATLALIAQRLGFSSAEHLSRLFSRHLGRSPGRWRRQH